MKKKNTLEKFLIFENKQKSLLKAVSYDAISIFARVKHREISC